jgi:hypothetical protein
MFSAVFKILEFRFLPAMLREQKCISISYESIGSLSTHVAESGSLAGTSLGTELVVPVLGLRTAELRIYSETSKNHN